jgi:hypothetical protein
VQHQRGEKKEERSHFISTNPARKKKPLGIAASGPVE